ncbi:5-(carboxyamino)imidazole ribonucleotide synthase [Pseudocolwellia agarivorans]|uniref:5-(carboxyamino)imidazole ribonucleotide synthase n=1 Tax=Pseudocolwellia agarivorans TaxID=1911682 RepID=UPI00098642E6|nr:5-(carboxyamino)imidazole ribonucleotide synthase [Pseudocolwellia agarivorans]
MNVLVLGAGQLARMMALASKPLNINVRAYDVGSERVVDPLSLSVDYGDLAQGILDADAITAEFEHIAHDVLAACEQSGKLFPSSQAIKTGGDRRLEKTLLAQAGVANAKHKIIANKFEFDEAIESLTLPLIMKSALAGYDGKGQWRLKDKSEAEAIWQEIKSFIEGDTSGRPQAIVVEQMVPFDREVSMVGVRSKTGQTLAYPLTENHHSKGVLSVSLAINEHQNLQAQATEAFDKIANALDYVGVLAIEFFQVGDSLLVNEIAPRVHNSGHWTQQGADTCQFENHIRAVCQLPLGSTELVRPTAMINILGTDSVPHSILEIPSVTLHWYGKGKRAGRKMGHINVCGSTRTELISRLTQLSTMLPNADFPDVNEYVSTL